MRALIVEDELLAVDNLKYYLKEYPIEIIGSAQRIQEAVNIINNEKPDVVFLDINLFGENGFDLLEEVEVDFKIVFVTAYDEYAVRAFEVNALDYILKPLKKERIAKAVEKLLSESKTEDHRQLFSIEDSIFLSTGKKAFFMKLGNIRYIKADSCYSKIVLDDKNTRCSTKTLKCWEELLPCNEFVRVHRSFIVNQNYIKEINRKPNGNYEISLTGMIDPIEISRRYASELKNKLSF